MSGGISASTIGMASLGIGALGAVMSSSNAYDKAKASQTNAVATYKAGQASAKASIEADKYSAKVEDNNAQIARWQAEDALRRGATAVNQHQLKVANLKGTQRAALAERGIDLGEGSALDILSDTEFMGQVDVNQLTDNANLEAWAFRNQGKSKEADAALLRMRAGNTAKAAQAMRIGETLDPSSEAAGSLLTGMSSVASNWYLMKSRT